MDDDRAEIVHHFELCSEGEDKADPDCVVSRFAKHSGCGDQLLVDLSRGGSKNARVGRAL